MQVRLNSQWFNDRITELYGSQRKLAPLVRKRNGKPMDQAALCRLLSGERAMQLDEARQFSQLLKVPFSTILLHAGITLEEGLKIPPEIWQWAKAKATAKGETAEDFLIGQLRKLARKRLNKRKGPKPKRPSLVSHTL